MWYEIDSKISIGLEELIESGERMLIDTNIINGFIRGKKDCVEFNKLGSAEEKIKFSRSNNEFVLSLIKAVENGALFYLTEEIIKEIDPKSYNYKKIIKDYSNQKDRLLLELRREINEVCRLKRKIIESFVDNERVISYEGEGVYSRIGEIIEKEIYEEKFNTFLYLKERYNLSVTDYDFLIKGIIMSEKCGCFVLLSNDFGIARAGNDIYRRGAVKEGRIRFFLRNNFFTFYEIGLSERNTK
ncbi:MAG: hypothetical protein QXU40_02090 [Candidatus Pacearchaeota archaeon]